MPFLLVRPERGDSRRVEIRGIAVLGRHKSCDVPIQDKQSSRKHARVFSDGKQFFVEDLSSRNGTYVNGNRVQGRIAIHNGDEIRIGALVATFQDERPDAPPRPAAPPRPSRAEMALVQSQEEVARFFGGLLFFLLLLLIFGATTVLSKFVFALVLSGL